VLPNRMFMGIGATEMCETNQAECVQPFAQIRSLIVVRLCKGQNEFKSVGGMQRRLHLHDHHLDKWQFIMVTREPVDRFLSGFIDRCIRVRDPCFGCGSNITCFLEEEYKSLSSRVCTCGQRWPVVAKRDPGGYPCFPTELLQPRARVATRNNRGCDRNAAFLAGRVTVATKPIKVHNPNP
ncbi:hypothetical protein TELCIR_14709, partial [Teladorsagia circumcincta]